MLRIRGSSAKASREKRFRYAVISSFTSKLTSAGLQIIAMPIAAISLGAHNFALYTMLMAAVGWLALSNIGIGPTMVVRLAAAHVHDDLNVESCIFSSGFIPAFIISAIVSITVILAVWTLPVHNIFGPLYVADEHMVQWGLTTLVAIFFLQTNLSLFEYAQAGYQEQYVQNLVATVSSLPCILAVLIIAKLKPTPVSLILAINVPIILFRCFNVAWIVRNHSQICPSLNFFRWSICKELVGSGAIFSLAGGGGNFLAHILPVILIGRSFSSEISASFAVTMNAVIIASGVISMISTPLWPAIADSVTRGDSGWARKAYRRLLLVAMTFASLISLFLAFQGEWLFQQWFNGYINPSLNLIFAAGIYFMALCWENIHFTILIGLNKIKKASLLVCARAIFGAVLIVLFLRNGGEMIPFIMMSIAVIIVDLIPLRKLVLRALYV